MLVTMNKLIYNHIQHIKDSFFTTHYLFIMTSNTLRPRNKYPQIKTHYTVSDWVPKKDSANFESDAFICFAAILKHPGSSRFGKEDPGYLRRCLQVIFSTFFFLNFAKKTQDI